MEFYKFNVQISNLEYYSIQFGITCAINALKKDIEVYEQTSPDSSGHFAEVQKWMREAYDNIEDLELLQKKLIDIKIDRTLKGEVEHVEIDD